ncbi:unnamed protein product, partial [Owenia fusiformis]
RVKPKKLIRRGRMYESSAILKVYKPQFFLSLNNGANCQLAIYAISKEQGQEVRTRKMNTTRMVCCLMVVMLLVSTATGQGFGDGFKDKGKRSEESDVSIDDVNEEDSRIKRDVLSADQPARGCPPLC